MGVDGDLGRVSFVSKGTHDPELGPSLNKEACPLRQAGQLFFSSTTFEALS